MGVTYGFICLDCKVAMPIEDYYKLSELRHDCNTNEHINFLMMHTRHNIMLITEYDFDTIKYNGLTEFLRRRIDELLIVPGEVDLSES